MSEEVKIYSIDEVLDRIGGYIDCSEFMDEEKDYQFSNIVYYLEKYQEQQQEIERLNNVINELTDLILLKKARAENEKDYSKYYIAGFTNALKITHSTPDGIMLETVKSTTIAICKEFLDKLKESKEE